ncbi:YeeE/YedE family protein [Phreatobacter cathodiphilus]|uniref:Uncharacterized protein n=1 Tax=Phreatobacter cathodiphilus TaxID=1868589 RepID=A0A2S0N858_9HYPH|nr:YeeE/YedE family protein [Phreatobacter cathodiphilus]AVO44133.1 hypothetical protein C6569_03110 [Phreatobacter cathodiphilus]
MSLATLAPKSAFDTPGTLPAARLVAAGVVAAIALAALTATGSGRLVLLGVIGLAMGLALYHAAFGFSHGYRALLAEGRTAHVRAQILMLAAAVLLFLPALTMGEVFGRPVRGFVFPLGLGVVLGAFAFGLGMQIAGGCISGTLYSAGGGSLRMWITLASAVAGATLAAFAAPLWEGLPQWPAVSLPAVLGLGPALLLHAALFAGAYAGLLALERRRTGGVESIGGRGRWLSGPWPYAWAALALAVLNFATLVVAGRPWGVTQAFALWGSKAMEAAGLADPVFWAFWEEPTRVETLMRPLAADATTVMNLAVMAGALGAALLAGRFAPSLRIPAGAVLGSVLGGLMIGAGAIVATGCNISAFFSGIASGSLHGWLWIAAALPGAWLGVKIRPLFGLT